MPLSTIFQLFRGSQLYGVCLKVGLGSGSLSKNRSLGVGSAIKYLVLKGNKIFLINYFNCNNVMKYVFCDFKRNIIYNYPTTDFLLNNSMKPNKPEP